MWKNLLLYWCELEIVAWPRAILSHMLPQLNLWIELPAMQVMQETRVQFLGQEDPLEKEMATHSSILTWEILWPEELGGLQFMKSQESDMI